MAAFLDILIFLMNLIIRVVALTVLLSFCVAWYERANSRPDLIDRRFTTRGLCLAIWLLIQETVCLLLTVLMRPLGWTTPQLQTTLPCTRPPVILLHGLFQNRSCLFWLQYRLKRAGYQQVVSINTSPWRDMEILTEGLAKKVAELRIRLRADKVLLVGHSMGGLIARNYVQHRGGTAYVQGMVTLGAPHHGSKLAPFALSPMGRTLLPGSEFLNHLNSIPWPEETPAISIYARYDNIVLPAESSRMEGARIKELDGMGHMALLFHPRSLQAVIDALGNITS